jgi:uridine phosphorylase
MSPIHVRPTARLADRVLLPGDPGRALALAQELIDQPKMFNHHRGLWGYTGPAKLDGEPLTIQSTGMGGPSAAIVLEELIALGARRAIRVGTCGALIESLRFGDLVLARETIAADGAGAMLARLAGRAANDGHTATGKSKAGSRSASGVQGASLEDACLVLAADVTLASAIERAAAPAAAGTIVSTDIFYEPEGSGREARWVAAGALAIEMEAAALFAVGQRRGVAIGCLLAVSDIFDRGDREHADDEELLAAAVRMGEAAVAALASA